MAEDRRSEAVSFAAAVLAFVEADGRIGLDEGEVVIEGGTSAQRDDLQEFDPALLHAVARCSEKPEGRRKYPPFAFAVCSKCGEPVVLAMDTQRRKSGAKCRITPKCEGKAMIVELVKK